MDDNQLDYETITKDHLRMRMEETGWTNMLTKMITTSITKRVESGQDVRSIKFDQLYTDIIEHARDTLTVEMELEFHQKYHDYLSSNLHETNVASTQASTSTAASSMNQGVPPSDIATNVTSVYGDGQMKMKP